MEGLSNVLVAAEFVSAVSGAEKSCSYQVGFTMFVKIASNCCEPSASIPHSSVMSS